MANRLTDRKIEELLEQLVDALDEAKTDLRKVETELRSHTPTVSGLERSFDNYSQYMDECSRSVERVRQLDRVIKSETGIGYIASVDAEVKNVLHRWEMVQAQVVEKDFKLVQHRHDSAQFHADINNMLSWLDQAEKMQRARTALPGDITQLDAIIRHHKEFLMQLETRKTRVQSINLISKDFIDLRTEEGRQLRDKLQQMNRRWENICMRATELQRELQGALMQCQEFHHTIHDLLLWLESIENKVQQCEPINLSSDESALWSKHRKLIELRLDLDSNRDRVMALKDTADQLLLNTDSTEMVNAKDKMHIIANRLRALHRLCSSYITSLEDRLEVKSRLSPALGADIRDGGSRPTSRSSSPRFPTFRPNTPLRMRTRSPFAVSRQLLFGLTNPMLRWGNHDNNLTERHEEVGRRPGYLSRVLRTALPLQLLLLLLLGVASLVPICEDEYSCVLMNNFRRSLGPMLQYTDGPPPV
ncbi:hypothetical protein FSP39_011059 [Pinctada imbricata]|uniref:KASH domain-containing protein n=1 Tax=Pinctada imbricata TaxID=66713 RepID=A0AA89C146_PINIB|nr:hypothetical protein FSP39_011059 [Pinctada imbricata]